MSPDLEEQLREYMRDMRVADVVGTMRSIQGQLVDHERRDEVRHTEVMGHIKGHSLRIGALEKKDEELRDSDKDLARQLENTGNWSREQLVTEKRKLEGLLWKLLFAIGGAMLGAVGAALAMLLK